MGEFLAYKSIGQYGLIGDMHSAALVGTQVDPIIRTAVRLK